MQMQFETVIEKWLEKPVSDARPLAGGDINQVYRVRMIDSEEFVLKLNLKDRFPKMFEKEASGLEMLHSAGCNTPGVKMTFAEGDQQFLILEFIEEGRPTSTSWERFGSQLASLHSRTDEFFGLDQDNYIGSLVQINERDESWTEFFITNRMKPLIKKATDRSLMGTNHRKSFESLFSRLSDLIPNERPSLLHGDLWSGNLMFDNGGEPVFIDPAVYYGHREVDIAMTRMFGGFNSSFLGSYIEVKPLEPGWEERLDLHNLYPTLVHLVLFGSSYLSGIERTLQRFL
jgi:fructosamine-3-kinase